MSSPIDHRRKPRRKYRKNIGSIFTPDWGEIRFFTTDGHSVIARPKGYRRTWQITLDELWDHFLGQKRMQWPTEEHDSAQ